jgi:hypothetical protein
LRIKSDLDYPDKPGNDNFISFSLREKGGMRGYVPKFTITFYEPSPHLIPLPMGEEGAGCHDRYMFVLKAKACRRVSTRKNGGGGEI